MGAAGALALLAALLLRDALFPAPPPLTERQVRDTVALAMASATAPPAYSAQVYQRIMPSLVLIQVGSLDEDGEGGGLGTGVLVDETGSILTALHVVEGALNITVTFWDGTQSAASLAGMMPEMDIAVLLPAELPDPLIPAILGNPNAMRVGDQAFVVGHPLGLYATMTAGVISGFDRSIRPVNSEIRLEQLIQIDAAVNPGNSGGPLLNRAGQVVGIVVGLMNPTEQEVFAGIGLAVPITIAGGAAGMPQY